MKMVYPVILKPDNDIYLVNVPDLDIMTEGQNIADAIDMARDAICLMIVDKQDDNKKVPAPSSVADVHLDDDEILTLVDVDIETYRRMFDNKAVKKNCTIPSWLNEMAEKEHINFSAVLREALEAKLNVR